MTKFSFIIVCDSATITIIHKKLISDYVEGVNYPVSL